jgi:DMSO/TMAO reductase YedYZ molybdopterin-dependent catalytic subunit
MPSKNNGKFKALPPGQTAVKQHPRWGKDHPTIGVATPKIDLKTWVLVIEGEVEHRLNFSWDNFLKLPKVESVSDFHCVEGWSVLSCRWEGVSFKHIMELVKPKETAKFVSFECADGYTTSLTLKELSGENVLLAYKLDGKELE